MTETALAGDETFTHRIPDLVDLLLCHPDITSWFAFYSSPPAVHSITDRKLNKGNKLFVKGAYHTGQSVPVDVSIDQSRALDWHVVLQPPQPILYTAVPVATTDVEVDVDVATEVATTSIVTSLFAENQPEGERDTGDAASAENLTTALTETDANGAPLETARGTSEQPSGAPADTNALEVAAAAAMDGTPDRGDDVIEKGHHSNDQHIHSKSFSALRVLPHVKPDLHHSQSQSAVGIHQAGGQSVGNDSPFRQPSIAEHSTFEAVLQHPIGVNPSYDNRLHQAESKTSNSELPFEAVLEHTGDVNDQHSFEVPPGASPSLDLTKSPSKQGPGGRARKQSRHNSRHGSAHGSRKNSARGTRGQEDAQLDDMLRLAADIAAGVKEKEEEKIDPDAHLPSWLRTAKAAITEPPADEVVEEVSMLDSMLHLLDHPPEKPVEMEMVPLPPVVPISAPDISLDMKWVFGVQTQFLRNSVQYVHAREMASLISFTTGRYAVVHDLEKRNQRLFTHHHRDILSTAVHPVGYVTLFL